MTVFSATILAVLLVSVVSGPVGQDNNKGGPGSSSSLPKKPFTDILSYTDEDYREVFNSLDLDKNGMIKIEELKLFYYHADSQFAIQKFMQMVDTQRTPGYIDREELKSFMNREQVKRRINGIKYIPTLEQRKRFYADEVLSYVYVVLDQSAIGTLFNELDTGKNGRLNMDEIREMENRLTGRKQHTLTDAEAKKILMELGAGEEAISYDNFKEYLEDGDLGYMFRECRKEIKKEGAEYDNLCVVRKLVRYATTYMTEYMYTLIFDALDAHSKNRVVDVEDVKSAFKCDDNKAKRFIGYYGGVNDELIYGRFRVVMDIPSIQTFLQNDCKEENLEERIECMKWNLWHIAGENFYPKYIGVPDLDLIFLFEDLDISNDGTIEQKRDLQDGKNWNSALAKKFIDEIGQPAHGGKVNLDDFFHYMYEPYTMCAVGECQIASTNKDKLACYNSELKDLINSVLTDSEAIEFFSFYTPETRQTTNDQQNNRQNNQETNEVISEFTLGQLTPKLDKEVIDNYLNELGMGNNYVDRREFKLFVKQQEPSHLFSTDDKSEPRNHHPVATLHTQLLEYLEKYMTEYDTFKLFSKLDKNKDQVIDKTDIEQSEGKIDAAFVERIALYGNKEHATYEEFWLFFNYKGSTSQEPRKRQLEKDCAQVNQEKQINCFVDKLKSVK